PAPGAGGQPGGGGATAPHATANRAGERAGRPAAIADRSRAAAGRACNRGLESRRRGRRPAPRGARRRGGTAARPRGRRRDGLPRVAGFAGEAGGLARGDPVAIIGYPLGEDLPMERIGENGVIADPTLTVGTVSKALANVVQVDGFGAPGSSGSPIFDRTGRVAAVLYGGNRESQGKIIYAVTESQVVAYLV